MFYARRLTHTVWSQNVLKMKEETENELKSVLGRMQYNGGQQITFSQAKEDEEVRKRVVDRPKERQEEKVSISYR